MRTTLICTFILVMISSVSMAGSGFYIYTVDRSSWVSIQGSTNINGFVCVSEGEIPRGYVSANTLPDDRTTMFSDAVLELRVGSFDCKNRMMNRDFQRSLGGDGSPYIQIQLLEARDIYDANLQQTGKIRAKVEITINQRVREKEIIVHYNQDKNGAFHFFGSKDLYMSEFGIDPPSPVLGLVRVNDQISINFRLVVQTSLVTQNQIIIDW